MMFSVYCGDFTEERTTLLSSVPLEHLTGTTLRTLWVLADPQESPADAYWVLTIGTFSTGGEMLALKVAPTGAEATPLTGLSVIPEYALSGAKAG